MNKSLIKKEKFEVIDSNFLNRSIFRIIDDYINEKYSNDSTISNYKRYLIRYTEVLNIQKMSDLKIPYHELRQKTSKFINHFQSDNTKRLVIAILKGFFVYLIDVYNYPKSPIAPIKLRPKQSKSTTKSATQEEIGKLLRKLDNRKELSRTDHLTYILVFTLATTSLRISECLQITKEMVEEGKIRVIQKQGQIRELELPEDTILAIKEFYQTYPDESAYVFTGKRGGLLRRQNAYKYIHEATRYKLGCHSFRKSVIEILIEKGNHPHEVAKVSGHKGINMIFYYDNRDSKTQIHKDLGDMYKKS